MTWEISGDEGGHWDEWELSSIKGLKTTEQKEEMLLRRINRKAKQRKMYPWKTTSMSIKMDLYRMEDELDKIGRI